MRAVLVVAAVMALYAPNAYAGWRVDRALAIAQIVWHPACGQLRLAFEPPPAGLRRAVAWAWTDDCTIRANSRRSHRAFEPFCEAVLHEAGHVAGMGHSDDSDSIMYPVQSLDRALIHGKLVWNVDSRCQNRGRPYLERHGTAF